MGDVIKFKKPRPSEQLKKKAKSHTMCKRGFHKWEIVTERKFDVKQGRLVTLFRCVHCHKEKTKSL